MVERGAEEETEKEGRCYCTTYTLILNLLLKKKKITCIKCVQVRFVFLAFFEDDCFYCKVMVPCKSWLPGSCHTFCACFALYLPSSDGK